MLATGELACEPAQQDRRHHVEQALQPVRPDAQGSRSGLNQDVKITYFDKTDSFQRAKDLLDRYDTLSTKLSVDYIDPDKKPQDRASARRAQLRHHLRSDVGTKREEAKSLTEEEVTGALIRALKGGERTVCAVQRQRRAYVRRYRTRRATRALKESIERNNYKTRTISLLEKPEVPKECTVLMVGGPRFDYVQPVVDAIKKYVEGGGRALIMLDPPVQMGKETVRRECRSQRRCSPPGASP